MSLFIAGQAFPSATDFSAAKIAVFAASILSAAVGTALLWRASRQERFEEGPQSVGTQVSPPAGVMPDLEQEVFR
jgi:NhaA family Na+:H+ antiporter